MKIKYLSIALIPTLGLLFACSNNEHKTEEKTATKIETTAVEEEKVTEPALELGEGETLYNTEEKISEGSVIGIAKGSSVVNWVAFKTNDKVPVGGTFDEVIIGGISNSDILTTAFTGATISIPVNTVNSNNKDRDGKIVKTFFGTLTNTDVITADIIEFTDNNEVVIEFLMNEVKHKVTCEYNVDKSTFSIDGVINLAHFNADKAVDALNTECKILHTGADGVSKLWSEVTISYTGTLTKK